jgi:hypothetical protein
VTIARHELVSQLIGVAFPKAFDARNGRLVTNWVARTGEVLPTDTKLEEIAERLAQQARSSIEAAYAGSATVEAIVAASPAVQLVRLGDNHLVVRIEFAAPGNSVGDAAMISQFGVLHNLDREIRLEELQGIPCEHWRLLGGAG